MTTLISDFWSFRCIFPFTTWSSQWCPQCRGPRHCWHPEQSPEKHRIWPFYILPLFLPVDLLTNWPVAGNWLFAHKLTLPPPFVWLITNPAVLDKILLIYLDFFSQFQSGSGRNLTGIPTFPTFHSDLTSAVVDCPSKQDFKTLLILRVKTNTLWTSLRIYEIPWQFMTALVVRGSHLIERETHVVILALSWLFSVPDFSFFL